MKYMVAKLVSRGEARATVTVPGFPVDVPPEPDEGTLWAGQALCIAHVVTGADLEPQDFEFMV